MKVKEINDLKTFKKFLEVKKFILYGAGFTGWAFVEFFCKKFEKLPILILDKKFKKKEKFLNIPALSPEKYEGDKEVPIVVAVGDKNTFNNVKKNLKKIGFQNIYKLSEKVVKRLLIESLSSNLIPANKSTNHTYKKETLRKINLKNNSVLLHIGWGKAGSTSIQCSLCNLKSKRFYYATFSTSINFNELQFLDKNFFKYSWSLEIKKDKNYKLYILEDLLKNIKKAGRKIFVISSEIIPALSEEILRLIINFLYVFYNDITIFGYIREPIGLVSSIFQEWQKIKFLPFEQINKCYFPYKGFFEKFFKFCKKEKIYLKKFDPKKFPDGCVVKDFCQTFGINLREQEIVRANVSLPKEVLNSIYILRKNYPKLNILSFHCYFLAKLIKDLLPNYKFTPFKISKEVIKPIVEENIEDIRWMESVLGEPLIDEEALKEPEPPWVVKTEEDLLTVPDEVVDALRNYTNYKLSNTKSMPQQVAEMLYQILKENFPDI